MRRAPPKMSLNGVVCVRMAKLAENGASFFRLTSTARLRQSGKLRSSNSFSSMTPQGETALTLATAWNHPDVVKTLTNFGKLTEPLKSAALEVAERGNRTELAQYLSTF